MIDYFILSSSEWEALFLSLKVSLLATSLSLPIGVFVAFILTRSKFPGKAVLDGIVHLPLVLPPVVIGYLLLLSLGKNGVLGKLLYKWFEVTIAFTWKGAAIAAAVMAFPLMVRAIRLSIESIDPGIEQAARTLGAGPLRVFFTITLPLMVPGIIAGAILAFVRSLGEFGATITFVSNIPGETQTLPLALYTSTQIPDGEGAALRLCVLAVLLAMGALLGSEILKKRFTKSIKG